MKTQEQAMEAPSLSPQAVNAWLDEIDTEKKREKDWREDAKKITELYEGDRREASPFNILYSNTATLAPALYNNTPRPAVGKRYKDKDPLAGAVSLTLNRTLSFTMDPNDASELSFDSMVETAILQALVPGRGVARWKYVAELDEGAEEVKSTPENIKNSGAEGDALQEDEAGESDSQEELVPQVKTEKICAEIVSYDRCIFGYAMKWEEVPWFAIEHHMTSEELEENFGSQLAAKVKTAKLESTKQDNTADQRKVAIVYEIWDKASKKVLFLTPNLATEALRIVPDPLGLQGFFPCSKPLCFMPKISSMIPQPLYNLYREQAEELNIITRRITAIVKALKVRGAYDSTFSELQKIFESDDNTLVAVENLAALMDGKTLKDALYLMPLSELVSVLQQLYTQRGQVKQVIYEITGISDILRGSSVASESATAQNIKNQWGTLRLKEMQKAVGHWCRDNLRIVAEIASNKFSITTFQAMTELPYITREQQQQAQQQMQQMQQQQIQAAQQAQMTGQPAPPPQEPPQELQEALATPVWEDILDLMHNKLLREFRIDIETNSTIADDMAEDQKNIGELLNALSQFLNGVAPLIENKTMPFEVAKSMMLGIVRKMAMGPEIEDQMEKMQPPAPPAPPEEKAPAGPDPKVVVQLEQQKAELEKQKLAGEMKKMEMEMQMAQQEFQNKMKLEQQKAEISDLKYRQQLAIANQKLLESQVPQNANL